jgi:hypothetical protein
MAWNREGLKPEIERAYGKAGIGGAWLSEQDYVLDSLRRIENVLEPGRFDAEAALGVGGSGVVLRLADGKFPEIKKALKFPRPLTGRAETLVQLIEKEITSLARLHHPGIVKILDYCTLPGSAEVRRLPFYTMEFVDGSPSDDYVLASPLSLPFVLEQASAILSYLHSSPSGSFAHLDIKPQNFVIDLNGRVVVIDLGTCKRLGTGGGSTTVACTRPFAHPALVRRLGEDPSDENRARGDLPRAELDARWDLWSLGMSLLSWLGVDPQSGSVLQEKVLDALDPYCRKYLFLLAARLLAGPASPNWLSTRVGLTTDFLNRIPIEKADDLYDLACRLTGKSSPLDCVPELNCGQTDTIQAAPGLHVSVTKPLAAVLQHPLFRRLASISQLGLVVQVYPGATHSRREHSLGTYANVIRIIHALYDDRATPLFRQLVLVEDIRAVLLVALLHDVGQFPLAHDLEEANRAVFNHTELTEAMIRGAWDKKKKGYRRVEFESLDGVLDVWGVPRERLVGILAAKSRNTAASPKDQLLRAMISGPIDADKLDYLLRDGRHLDLPYPLGIDIERLLACTTTVVLDKLPAGQRDVPILAVQSKGRVAAEFLSLARYAMFSQAYWHHAVRAQKAMLTRAVLALTCHPEVDLASLQSDFIDFVYGLPGLLYGSNERGLFPEPSRGGVLAGDGVGSELMATDAAVLCWLRDRLVEKNLPEALLVAGILRRNFFKRLWVVTQEMDGEVWDKTVRAWKDLSPKKRHTLAYECERRVSGRISEVGIKSVTSTAATTAEELIEQRVSGHAPWLLVDIPAARPGSEVPLQYVLEGQRRSLRKDDRSVGSLESSRVWQQYAEGLFKTAGKIRVFADPLLVDTLEASVPWQEGMDEVVTAIESTAE